MADHSSKIRWKKRLRIFFFGLGLLLFILIGIVVVEAFTLTEEERGVWSDSFLAPFKCTSCGKKVSYHPWDVEKMIKSTTTKPWTGPVILTCPECEKHTLTQAVSCVACKEIYVTKLDATTGKYTDLCPACGKSYSKLWQEKYRQSEEEPGIFRRIRITFKDMAIDLWDVMDSARRKIRIWLK